MGTQSQRRNRLKLVIEKDFQYRFTINMCLIAGLIFLLCGGILLLIVRMNYEAFIQYAVLQMPATVSQLERELRMLSLGLVAALLLMVSMLFGLGLMLTHRVAGPLYALKRRLEEFSEGQSGVRLNLRTKDEFHNLERVFNRAMEVHDLKQKETTLLLDTVLTKLRSQNAKDAESLVSKFVDSHKKSSADPKISRA